MDIYQDPKAKKAWTNVTRGGPALDGLKTMTGWDQFVIKPADDGKLVSVNTLALNGSVSRSDVSNSDPDVTVSSNSLLTDPVNGGLKKDLSLLSGRGLSLNEKSMRLYKSAGVIADNVPSDPFLSLLTNYHQLYKRLGQPNGVSPGPYQVAARLPDGREPYDNSSGVTVVTRAPVAEPLLVPAVVRVDIIFSMITRKTHGMWVGVFGTERTYELHLQYLPIITLHNPYSVPLVLDGMRVSFKNLPVGVNFMVDGQEISSRLVAVSQMTWGAQDGDTASKDFGISLTRSTSGSSSALTLEPGQTKLFGSPKVPSTWRWIDEQPGFGGDGIYLFDHRNNQTAAFNMSPTMITPPTGGGAGFDVDWVNPVPLHTAKGNEVGQGYGMCGLRAPKPWGQIRPAYASCQPGIVQRRDRPDQGRPILQGGRDHGQVWHGTTLERDSSEGDFGSFSHGRSFPNVPKAGVDPAISPASL